MKDRLLTISVSALTTLVLMTLLGQTRPASVFGQRGAVEELVVDRLIVHKELIVSDTGKPWDAGFERQEIPRGLVARSLGTGTAGVWVRGRLIKTEIDDPFDDRFHAINRDGSICQAPGHLSWNVWVGDAWRQMAILQGEGLENNEMPREQWNGGNHPGRLRFQTFRPHHDEPLTDATIGQGKMSLGGGGYGGGGLPVASDVLQLWGGKMIATSLPAPAPPRVMKHDGTGKHTYALIAVGPQGTKSEPSPIITADSRATLAWDSVAGADGYIVVRDGQQTAPIRAEGSEKHWTDATPTE